MPGEEAPGLMLLLFSMCVVLFKVPFFLKKYIYVALMSIYYDDDK